MARRAATLGIISAMKDWPPKPGSTVMARIMLTCSTKGSAAWAGVPGLRTMPARLPLARILSRAARISSGVSDSTCTVTMSAPASQKASTYRTGRTIMRCTSSGSFVTGRMHRTTGMPMVMLGTNTPSITSTWT